ncbi:MULTISPECIES: DNA polymerase III subunit alpha [Solibacillus]|uniref:DNA-directed DNA polymerase n=1 Tax=Solibacillus merdavium TaxID=2762218 RepID=A0ABR8XK68_9BACL|nr:DNA polymerase III subunit alpha [Solibacillus merdavium]MBD8032302.1 DNA polymerase III subunit alpha [Solibacillus merdavium]
MTVYPQIRTSADLLKSTIRLEELIPFLHQQKAKSCAIVNTKLYGLLPFWFEMKRAGIHPVIGLTIQLEWTEEQSLPLVLYAKTNEGYQNLLKISSSIAIRSDQTIPLRWLLAYGKGIVFMIPALDLQGRWLQQTAENTLLEIKNAYSNELYIGISRGSNEGPFERQAVEFAVKNGLPIVATHESLFLKEEDFFSYEVAQAIETGVKLNEAAINNKQESYVLTAEQWQGKFQDEPQWLLQMESLLMSCQVQLTTNDVYMPRFPLQKGDTAEKILQQQVVAGLQRRLKMDSLPSQYLERMNYELDVIQSMGYSDYFLIVADFMRFAREEQILTGPGRGSSASSLVAYALEITQVDPLQYDLLFERFLNPERITLPDIDIDFLDTRRHEVIQYVAKKYGKQYVAQIITFGTLSAKAVARDVARMFNFESETLEMISKLIPNKPGITLQEAYSKSENLREWIAAEPIRQKWFKTSLRLEGLPRNASTHAAGVVLSPVPLVDIVPIEEGHEGIYLTQWPMLEVEQTGLLKIDFLGLRNLTILEQIRKSIQFTHDVRLDFNQIPLNDGKTFELLQHGDTAGIFQLESDGMKNALREIKPTHFLDIVAVNALYRPGPMEFIPLYARRKHKKEQVMMPHPDLTPILEETHGVIIYQEQIMRIANVMAGFSFGQADLLRRAVSKKKRDVLEQQRASFVKGAMAKGYTEQVAEEVYALIVRFADYGFPKSHAVAYSIISYQMAYLKANYPVNFYAALLTNATGNTEKLAQILMEAKARGIEILPPSINRSMRHFKVEGGKIRFSFSAIKGVPQPFLQKLLIAREERQKPFESIFDLAVTMTTANFNRKIIEPLIKAGALDEFGKDRATLLATIEGAQKQADFVRPGGDDLFEGALLAFGKPKYNETSPIPEKIKLQYEKEVLGFYLSDHPIVKVRKHFPEVTATVQTLSQLKENAYVKMIGQVQEMRQLRTKRGELMAFVQLEDEYGAVSLTLFPKEYEKVVGKLQEDTLLYIEGFFEHRFNKSQIKIKEIIIK